jgi:hypothetical protein
VIAISKYGAEPRVLVAPITHSPPPDAKDAIDIPGAFNHMTGLERQAASRQAK